MSSRNNINVCVVKSGDLSITETFILAHATRLPGNITLIQGHIPRIANRPVRSQLLLARALRKGWRLLRGYSWEWEITSGYIAAFRRICPDAVVAEYGTTGIRVMEICRQLGIPLIVHFHGSDASKHEVLKEYSYSYSILFHRAAAIVAVSRAMQEKLVHMGAPEDKVHYNPYGVDCQLFKLADPAGSRPVFVSVGRFVDKKAPHLTLLAFADVRRVFPDARLRMIGDGPLLGACKDLGVALGIDDAVTFLGAQPHAIVREEMQQSRCFVQHSVEATSGDSEGTPVAILEAGATGLPVISTRHTGIPDVVIDGQTGFLVDERDTKTMAAHMLRMVHDPELARKLGAAARYRIESNFSMERSIRKLWSIIEVCIGTQEGRRVTIPLERTSPVAIGRAKHRALIKNTARSLDEVLKEPDAAVEGNRR